MPVFHHGFVTDMDFYRDDVIGVFNRSSAFLNWRASTGDDAACEEAQLVHLLLEKSFRLFPSGRSSLKTPVVPNLTACLIPPRQSKSL